MPADTSQELIRHDWSFDEIMTIHQLPFPDLIHRAQTVHRKFFSPTLVQRSTLLSIKTGGCPEDCKYCPQSAHYSTGVDKQKLLSKETVLEKAQEAKDEGSTRFCMGAAWREIKDGKEFDQVLDIVGAVHGLGLEVCCTLGMLSKEQAERLKEAGCFSYNHNLDTSPEFYGDIISTRTYEQRLKTLEYVREVGMTVCCGGILGLGERTEHRVQLFQQLANQPVHPESVPINMLVRIEGTPLENEQGVDPISFVRAIATARIIMPKSMVRLSAGRKEMSDEMQALCFIAGANSVFSGDKLLTTDNPETSKDLKLMESLGMQFASEEDIQQGNLSEASQQRRIRAA